MKDIQNQYDSRRINIKKVGVKEISYPISVLDKAKAVQRTVATVNMYVNLPHRFKGTHMSRFIEILNRYHGAFDLRSFRSILEEMKRLLDAQAAHMELEFPYFLKKGAGGDKAIVLGEYDCRMHGVLDDEDSLTMEVRVPITSPRPGQRREGLPRFMGRWGVASISLRYRRFIWLEDLIQLAEEVIADNQMPLPSVEVITKALGARLAAHPDIRWFSVSVENYAEGFSTFATLEWPLDGAERDNHLQTRQQPGIGQGVTTA